MPVRAFGSSSTGDPADHPRGPQGPGAMETLCTAAPQRQVCPRPHDMAAHAPSCSMPADPIETAAEHLRPAGRPPQARQMVNGRSASRCSRSSGGSRATSWSPTSSVSPVKGSGLNVFGLGADSGRRPATLRRMGAPGIRELQRRRRANSRRSSSAACSRSAAAAERAQLDGRSPSFGGALYGQMVARLPVVARPLDLSAVDRALPDVARSTPSSG